MGLFFQLILLTLFYYVGLLLFQNRRAQQLEILQKEVIGKTKPTNLLIPPKEEIFGATSKLLKEMQVQSNDMPSNDVDSRDMPLQSGAKPSEEQIDPIKSNLTKEPLKARELLFKGTLSDTSSKKATSITEESAIQQTVQQIIEGTSLANTELELAAIQAGSTVLQSNDKQKDKPPLNKFDFIPTTDQGEKINLLYHQDIPQLMDYHKRQKK